MSPTPIPESIFLLMFASMGEQGITLTAACQQYGLSISNTLRRISESPTLKEAYTRARESYAQVRVDAMETIARDTKLDPQTKRLMCDNIKWEVAKVVPKFWGERVQVDHSGAVARVDPETLTAEERAFILASLKRDI